MTSTISGLGSGFDIDAWVSSLVSVKRSNLVSPLQTKLSALEYKNSALSDLKGKYTSLQGALQTFTKTLYSSSGDMWANTKINSSNSDYVTASSSGTVAAASVKVEVEKIATATIAQSNKSLGANKSVEDTEFVKLANGQAKEGTFSIFLDDKKYQIEIDSKDTLGDVIKKINDIGKPRDEEGNVIESYEDEEGNTVQNKGVLNATLTDGVLSIKPAENSSKLVLGSTGDTSNIVSALKLYEKDENGIKSSYAISKVNTSAAMASEDSGLDAINFTNEGETGIIKINGAEFTVDKNTTLNSLISKINGNSDAHVKASYDSLTNKVILTATETGASNIALEEEGTNILNVLGLTEGTGDDEKLAAGSQTLGDNALVKINDNVVISNSNTITGESSGIANLSITIKKPTPGGAEDVPSSVSLDIEPDYSKVKDSLKKFVDAYNDVVSSTKSTVASDGYMAHDSSLSSILNTIKSFTSTSIENDGKFSFLSQIGISTSSSDPTKLSIDNSKLDEVLSGDFDSVKALLSDGYTNEEDTGLFDKMLKNVNNILDADNGYFSTKTDSIDSQIKLMNTRIERANTQLTKYETRITEQFNRMDSIMSQLSTQLSTFQAYVR